MSRMAQMAENGALSSSSSSSSCSQLSRGGGGGSACQPALWGVLRLGLCGAGRGAQDGHERRLEPTVPKRKEKHGASVMTLYWGTFSITVEPLNNVTFGTSYSVHYIIIERFLYVLAL